MSIIDRILSVWKSLPISRRTSSAWGHQGPVRIEPLEIRALLAGEFTDLGALGITGVYFGSVAWGDVDNDADADVLLTGIDSASAPVARVYRNNGNNTFTDLNVGLVGVIQSSAAWGDADNDGDLDILLTGFNSATIPVAKVYRNNGNSTFTDANVSLTGVVSGSLAWGDADNDGDLDIVLAGTDSTNARVAKVYRNNGGLTFSDLNAGLTGVTGGSVAWGDADNDGDLDILLCGLDSTAVNISKIYRNNGDNTFTDMNAGLTGANTGSAAWGDFDNDGDLDILITGFDSPTSRIAKVYRNNGNSTFTDLNAGLTGVIGGSVAWGDADNDGDLDILLTGTDATSIRIAKIYRNNGNSTFTDLNVGLTGVIRASVAWGDFDNDRDLDVILTGIDSTNTRITKIYRNNAATANTPPVAPANLSSANTGTTITFSWTAPADAQTSIAGLSYNLRVGTTPGGSDIFSTMANAANGTRRLPDAGPIQGTSYSLKNLTPGVIYYWSVQAIDTTFAGSAFAAEQTASISFTDLGALGLPGVDFGSAAWGDVDGDGDLDILLTGRADPTLIPLARIYRNNGNGTFTDLNVGLTGVFFSSVAWGDMDNDGDLDILLTGFDANSALTTKIYRNNGNSTFTDLGSLGLTGVNIGSVAWGDADNDGDLDILLTGQYRSSTGIAKIYRNNGNGSFSDINAGLTGVLMSSAAWGDADNDGDLDILIAGRDNTDNETTKFYRNNGNSTFTELNTGLIAVEYGSVSWGDADSDGDLDILLTGRDSTNARIAKLYQNNGNNTFTDLGALGFTGVYKSSVAWGDADNDGDLDILLNGLDGPASRIAKVYRNNGNSTFTDLHLDLTGSYHASVAWGDSDNDGDLDILLTGRHSSTVAITKIYRNNSLTPNTPPAPPTNLSAVETSGSAIHFSWTSPHDVETPAAVLSYNLRVGTTPGGSDVFSTMANTVNGTSRLPDTGPIQGTSYTLKGLTPGITYYWSVQAIDTTLAGGAFAAERTAFVNTAPTLGGAMANQPVNDNATINPLSAFTVNDPDPQAMSAIVQVTNGVVRGDFTAGSTAGWSRAVIGNNIQYSHTFSATANIGATVQTAIRAFVFQPRSNAIPPNTTETTGFSVTVSDGIAVPVSNSTTTVITTSVNNAPVIGGASATVMVNDNATINPFPALTVTDADNQEMLISVTILNGVVRGDFTAASTANWLVRYVIGNNITYKRYFNPGPNVGATAQAAFRALLFQPRANAIKPGTTEATDFQVTASDGVAPAVANTGTRVTTTSVNNAPTIGGAVANQTMNDNATKAVFSTLTVTDPDTQETLVRVTIVNGVNRGDFTAASTAGWSHSVVGNDIVYARYFSPSANIGVTVQTAIRVLVFQPRNNVPIATTETTSFTVFINDGIANVTNSATTVITTGVAPRPAPVVPSTFRESDITTVVLPGVNKTASRPLVRLLKRSR